MKQLYRLVDPENGRMGHAEITIRGVLVMLGSEYAEVNKSPTTLGGTAVTLGLMSADVKADFERAVSAGAGVVRDPVGHEWIISQEFEKLSPEEMQRRWDAMVAGSE
jgi:PhnB protein